MGRGCPGLAVLINRCRPTNRAVRCPRITFCGSPVLGDRCWDPAWLTRSPRPQDGLCPHPVVSMLSLCLGAWGGELKGGLGPPPFLLTGARVAGGGITSSLCFMHIWPFGMCGNTLLEAPHEAPESLQQARGGNVEGASGTGDGRTRSGGACVSGECGGRAAGEGPQGKG